MFSDCQGSDSARAWLPLHGGTGSGSVHRPRRALLARRSRQPHRNRRAPASGRSGPASSRRCAPVSESTSPRVIAICSRPRSTLSVSPYSGLGGHLRLRGRCVASPLGQRRRSAREAASENRQGESARRSRRHIHQQLLHPHVQASRARSGVNLDHAASASQQFPGALPVLAGLFVQLSGLVQFNTDAVGDHARMITQKENPATCGGQV